MHPAVNSCPLWLSVCCTQGQACNTPCMASAHRSQQHEADCCRAACRLSNNFQEATRLATQPMPSGPPAGHVLVRNAFAGVNASDINYSSGRQASHLHKVPKQQCFFSDKPPHDCCCHMGQEPGQFLGGGLWVHQQAALCG